MHAIVHDANEDTHGRKFVVPMPQQVKDRGMVKPVKENELLFVNNDKECIQELAMDEKEELHESRVLKK